MNYDLAFHLFNEMAEPPPLRQMAYFIINKPVVFFFVVAKFGNVRFVKVLHLFIRDTNY
jgi:hypothetical protein